MGERIEAGLTALAAAVAMLATGAAVAQNHAPEPAPANVISANALLASALTTTIASGGMRVTIALPDAQRGFYRATRFDWAGMITAVDLTGTHFYGPWFDGMAPNVHDFVDNADGVFAGPRNAGTGPAEEFASRDGETVPGYNAAPVGGTFIKIGVGRLRKETAEPYDHFSAYPIVDGGTRTTRRAGDRITFIQRVAPDASGYGFDYEKTIRVEPGGVMTISHRLRNIGTKPIVTQVYNHNLARFDGADLGPGVSARFPDAIAGAVSAPDLATVDGDTMRYTRPLGVGDRVLLPAQPGKPGVNGGPFTVTGANGATITMQADTPLVRTVLWSTRHVVAIEPFVQLNVAPGAEQSWSWRYMFTPATARPAGARPTR